jgi:hypothetical protein
LYYNISVILNLDIVSPLDLSDPCPKSRAAESLNVTEPIPSIKQEASGIYVRLEWGKEKNEKKSDECLPESVS